MTTRAEAPDGGDHDWFMPVFTTYLCCRKCGIVRRADGKNRPCPGRIGITLRSMKDDANG